MRFWLIGLFLVLPVLELAVIIKVGGWLGVWPTIGLMLLSAVAGSFLMRRQGLAALADLQLSFRELRDPTAAIAHGALILLAGALMVAPGFLTDLTGLALLVPQVRRGIIRGLASRVRVTRHGFGFAAGADIPPRRSGTGRSDDRRGTDGTPIIDGEFMELEEHPQRPGRGQPSGWTRP